MNRREFMGKAAVTVGAAAMAGHALPDAEAAARLPRSATEKVALGRTKIRVSVLGIGTGTSGWGKASNQTRMGQAAFTRLVRHAYDNGITFFDVADQYGSHSYLKEALKGIPRDKIVIQSKINSREPGPAKADLDRIRLELGTDYIDSLLMHVVTRPTWASDHEGVRDLLSESKQKKIIRNHGVSCHGFGALKTAAATPWVEVDLARINPKGMHMDDKPENVVPVLKEMRAKGKGVVGMKIFGQGDMKTAEERDESLRYVLGSGAVDAFVIGFESTEQIDDTIRRINRALKDLRASPVRI